MVNFPKPSSWQTDSLSMFSLIPSLISTQRAGWYLVNFSPHQVELVCTLQVLSARAPGDRQR